MCTLMLFPFLCCARSSSISHITLTPVSPQPSLRSFITVSVKRWLGSQECHANVAPLCTSAHWRVLVCLLMCLCPFMHVFFYFWGGLFFRSFFFVFLFYIFLSPQKAPETWRCVAAVTERGVTERVDGEEVRRSSAAATGRGQRGWQCLLVASLSTWLCLNPAWGQRHAPQHARQLLRRVKKRLIGGDRAKLALH